MGRVAAYYEGVVRLQEGFEGGQGGSRGVGGVGFVVYAWGASGGCEEGGIDLMDC